MSGGDKTQTTKSDPWGPAQGYLKELMSGSASQFRQGLTEDWKKDYVGLNDDQLAAINQLQSYYQTGGKYDELTGQATSAWQNQLRDPTKVAQSQEVKDMITAMTNPMIAQLNEQMLPQVRSGASGAGQYGGTRQGVAEGVAMGQTQKAMGDTAAKMTGDVYTQALQNQLQALNMSGQMADLQSGGQRQLFDLGNLLRGDEQAAKDIDYWNRTQAGMSPYQQWASMMLPFGGLGGTQSTTVPGASPLQQWGGAALAGLGAYSSLSSLFAPPKP